MRRLVALCVLQRLVCGDLGSRRRDERADGHVAEERRREEQGCELHGVLSKAMAKVGSDDTKGQMPGCAGEIEMMSQVLARLGGRWCGEKMTRAGGRQNRELMEERLFILPAGFSMEGSGAGHLCFLSLPRSQDDPVADSMMPWVHG